MMQILIRAPKEIKSFLQNNAKRIGITLNALILQILWDWAMENGFTDKRGESDG